MTVPSRYREKINVEIIDQQNKLTLDEAKIKEVVTSILTDADIQRGSMEIVIVDAETIHQLNVEFLGHDYVTDVLAFEMDSDEKHHMLEGNVIVCADTALERASEFAWSPKEELLLYIVHGTLHLVGYDDHTEVDAPAMRNKEREYLGKIGISIPEIGNDNV